MENFTKGESVEFTKEFSNFSAEDWTLTYYIRGTGKGFDVTATATGKVFKVTIPATTTEGSSAGKYSYQAFVTKESQKILVESGTFRILPNLSNLQTTDSFDSRSDAEKLLEAIDAVLANRASIDQSQYQIGSRALTRIPIPELIQLRDKYQGIVNQERRAKKLKNGLPFMKNIGIRFVNPK